jgi:hypothetical protein
MMLNGLAILDSFGNRNHGITLSEFSRRKDQSVSQGPLNLLLREELNSMFTTGPGIGAHRQFWMMEAPPQRV